MARKVDPLVHNTMLDANLLDEVVSGTCAAVNRMMELYDSGDDINIVLPYSVRDELNRPATPAAVRTAANRFIYSIRVQLTPPEIANRDRLIEEARGNSKKKNVERDLNHIFEAGKHGGGQFVTRDDWLLRKAERIWDLAQVEVVTPEQFVEKAEVALERRTARGQVRPT
jgi:hypothetical protein